MQNAFSAERHPSPCLGRPCQNRTAAAAAAAAQIPPIICTTPIKHASLTTWSRPRSTSACLVRRYYCLARGALTRSGYHAHTHIHTHARIVLFFCLASSGEALTHPGAIPSRLRMSLLRFTRLPSQHRRRAFGWGWKESEHHARRPRRWDGQGGLRRVTTSPDGQSTWANAKRENKRHGRVRRSGGVSLVVAAENAGAHGGEEGERAEHSTAQHGTARQASPSLQRRARLSGGAKAEREQPMRCAASVWRLCGHDGRTRLGFPFFRTLSSEISARCHPLWKRAGERAGGLRRRRRRRGCPRCSRHSRKVVEQQQRQQAANSPAPPPPPRSRPNAKEAHRTPDRTASACRSLAGCWPCNRECRASPTA